MSASPCRWQRRLRTGRAECPWSGTWRRWNARCYLLGTSSEVNPEPRREYARLGPQIPFHRVRGRRPGASRDESLHAAKRRADSRYARVRGRPSFDPFLLCQKGSGPARSRSSRGSCGRCVARHAPLLMGLHHWSCPVITDQPKFIFFVQLNQTHQPLLHRLPRSFLCFKKPALLNRTS